MFDPKKILQKAKKGISIDTRTIKPGQLFISIKGPKYDGHDFIPQAIAKGACGIIMSNDKCQMTNEGIFIIKVKNTLKALQDLAAYHRSRFKIPVIGITGSCGKTTTKDMLASILSQEYPVLKNKDNYNNEIGVPLTLLELTKKHKAAVIEMAMQKRGEIADLVKIVKPTISVITNIGEAHLKFLKNKKNVAKAKAEILKGCKYAVLPEEDEYFKFLRSKILDTRYLDTRCKIVPFSKAKNIMLSIPGEYNLYNAGAAIAVAKILKINAKSIKKGLEKFKPSHLRSEIIDKNGVRIINDCYNANPTSMQAALGELRAQSLEHRRKSIAVLGDMLELGTIAKSAHKKIIQYAKELGIDVVLTFGNLWPKSSKAYKNKKTLAKSLRKIIKPGDIILIKGSRGMKMEEICSAAVVELADTYA